MISDLLINIFDTGFALLEWFLLPGEFMLSRLITHAPVFAESVGIDGNDGYLTLRIALSLLAWSLLTAVTLKILDRIRNFARRIIATCKAGSFRFWLSVHNIKRTSAGIIRKCLSWRRSGDIEMQTVEFDELDMAVLRFATALPPSIALSAPDLVEQLTMRPAQIQRSLDKLRSYKMLEFVIGSTDGFDNYRATPSGTAFITTLG
jgi:hypothetical protein